MKTSKQFVGASLLIVAAGTVLASPAPTAVRRPLTPGIDVSLSAIGVGTGATQTGAFAITTSGMPAGLFGMTGGTTSCNQQPDNGPPTARFPAGNAGIVADSPYFMGDWYAPFESGINWDGTNLGADAGNRHPYISQAIYRINAEGRLEQLGTNWFKHSWSAASGNMSGQPASATGNDPCGIGSNCLNLSTDNQLEANCADTYSSGHNSDNFYMGPRNEVHPRKGYNEPGWSRFGSYIDKYTNTNTLAPVAQRTDGIRSTSSGAALPSWKRALVAYNEIDQAALGANGKVIIEGYYVVNGDSYKLNNVAHRQLNSTVATGATTASTTNFPLSGRHQWGPALLQWGEQKSVATPQTDGDVYVSSRAVSLGGGLWRYEYNVFNLDFERRVASFEVPVPSFATVTDVNFRQPRQLVLGEDTAPWTSAYDMEKKAIVWSPQAAPVLDNAQLAAMVPPLEDGTVIKPNTLVWGTMYTFYYTCNLDPRSDVASKMNARDEGTFAGPITAEVRGPRHPADIGVQGGDPGSDGVLNNNDFISFIGLFFAADARADIGVQGGGAGQDGLFDNNDFIAFISFFFNS